MIEILLQAERALTVGLVDQAERLYRQASDADPRNSIAVVGLARVALERGDEPEAWRQARRALAIDPENVAAQRLARRLEEVWAFQGRSLPEAAGAAAAGGESAGPGAAPVEAVRQGTAPVAAVEVEAASAQSALEASAALPAASAVGAPAGAPAEAPEPGPSEVPGSAPAETPERSPERSPAPAAAPPHRPSMMDRLLRRNRP